MAKKQQIRNWLHFSSCSWTYYWPRTLFFRLPYFLLHQYAKISFLLDKIQVALLICSSWLHFSCTFRVLCLPPAFFTLLVPVFSKISFLTSPDTQGQQITVTSRNGSALPAKYLLSTAYLVLVQLSQLENCTSRSPASCSGFGPCSLLLSSSGRAQNELFS